MVLGNEAIWPAAAMLARTLSRPIVTRLTLTVTPKVTNLFQKVKCCRRSLPNGEEVSKRCPPRTGDQPGPNGQFGVRPRTRPQH